MSVINNLVKMKEKAFEYGTNLINALKQEIEATISQRTNAYSDEEKKKFIGLNAIDVANLIYNNPKFYEYLKYSFLAKHYQSKINLIEWIIVLVAVLFGILSYVFLGFKMIFIIIAIILVVVVVIVFAKLKTGESYKSYYNRTMLDFILNIYEANFSVNKKLNVTDSELRIITHNSFDKKTLKNKMNFVSELYDGNILDVELVKTVKHRDRDGNVVKNDSKVFDGFYLKINVNSHINMLKGNTVSIIADENILSSLAEDTVKGIYESKREFSFNSEEMNKSFDCRVSGYLGFSDIDDMMMTVHKIITPSFEQHLLYLRERYNSFNMNISDNGIAASFNMERSLFQKAKHKELLDFKTTYREANEKFRFLKASVMGIDDFAYYNVFPFLERLLKNQ